MNRRIQIVWLLLAVGALLRIGYLVEFSTSPLFPLALGADVSEYDQRAREILGGAWLPTAPELHAPLYSYFLALLYRLTDAAIPAVRAIQLLLNFAAWGLFYRFLRRRSADADSLPEWFLAFAMCYTPLFFFQAELVSEALLLPLLLGAIAATIRAQEAATFRARCIWSGATGAIGALAALTHPMSLLLLLGLLGGLAWQRATRLAALAGIGAALLLLAPWSWQQSRLAGRPVLIQTNSMFNVHLGNRPGASGGCELRPGSAWKEFHAASAASAAASGMTIDAYFARETLHFFAAHPGEALVLFGRKALLIFSPAELPAGADVPAIFQHTRLLRYSAIPLAALLFALACGGAILLLRDREKRRFAWPLLLAGGAFALAQILTVTSGRYRLAMLPALFYCAAFALPRMRAALPWTALGAVIGVAAGLCYPKFPDLKPEAISLYADALYRQNRAAAAEALLLPRIADSNDPARDWNLLGEIRRQRGDRTGAAAAYRQAAELAPTEAEGLNNLGTLAAADGDLAGAEQLFAAALHRDPQHPDSAYNLALVQIRRGNPERAEELLRELLRRHPAHRPAWNELGTLAFRRGDFRTAVAAFAAALRLDPKNPGIRRNFELAQQYLRRSSPEK